MLQEKRKWFCNSCQPSSEYVSLEEREPLGGLTQACYCDKDKTKCLELWSEHDAKSQVHTLTNAKNANCALAMLFGRGLRLDANKVCAMALFVCAHAQCRLMHTVVSFADCLAGQSGQANVWFRVFHLSPEDKHVDAGVWWAYQKRMCGWPELAQNWNPLACFV